MTASARCACSCSTARPAAAGAAAQGLDQAFRAHHRLADEAGRPEAGLAVLCALQPPGWLARCYLWDATLGGLLSRADHRAEAATHLARALPRAPHPAERAQIAQRLAACGPG